MQSSSGKCGRHPPLQALLLIIFPLFLLLNLFLSGPALSLSFDYPSMGQDAIQKYVTGMGNVSFDPDYVDLTAKNNNPFESTGRIYNADQLFLWDLATQQAASFNCSFTLSILPINNSPHADGLAFFLLDPKLSEVPDERKGSGLGLPLNAYSTGFVAVEFDTFLNLQIDYSDNHIGIDINSVVSAKYTNLSFGLINSSVVYSWVDYSSSKSLLDVYATNLSTSTKPTSPVLSYSINLTQFLPQYVLIGFSAATGGKAEYHRVHSWSFNSTSIGKEQKRSNVSLIAGLTSSTGVVVGIVILVLLLLQKRRSRRRRQRLNDRLPSAGIRRRGLPLPSDADLGPQKFSYRDLCRATNNFGDDCLLGKGGSGSVYRGLLPDTGREVAVKCISTKSTHGEKEFDAEVEIISRIRHKNLVQLKGWCRDNTINLHLVYEYLPNGSLDRFLFSKTSSVILDWSKRYNIVCGLGYAVQYLHQECERVIVHRDIKASNVMLDANYNAKLGDFGLARQLREGVEGHTTQYVAGTLGYMAPETYWTRRAATMSDVYSYGIVLLEVVCGRRPSDAISLPGEFEGFLLDWVRDLHSKGRLGDACDSRLEGAADEEQVMRTLTVGLACSHPDPKSRPSIQVALDGLEGRGALPVIPTDLKPFVSHGPHLYFSNNSLSSSTTISSTSATLSTHPNI